MHERSYVSGTNFCPEIGVYGGWVAHRGSMAERLSAARNGNCVALLLSGECFATGLMDGEPVSATNASAPSNDHPVLGLYDREADLFAAHLEGLFSGLLIDPQQKRALLFNDRYGCERIYHYEKDGATYFASEAKALLRAFSELREFDDEGVAQFLAYGCTLGGRTLFKGIRFLPGGSLWSFDAAGATSKKRYFHPEQWEPLPPLTENAFENAYLAAFRRALPRYVNSTTNVGIALTGGLDTRMIMARILATGVRPVCYTFAGTSGETLDVRLAARVADACGLEHHTLRIGADFVSEYGRHVDQTVFITDGCAGALAAHEIYLNVKARELAPVRLTGNYGSEILRGMSTFKRQRFSGAVLDMNFRKLVEESSISIPEKASNPVTRAAFQEIPWLHFGTLAAGRSQLTFRTPYLDSEIVRLALRAPDSARHSANSALRLVHECNSSLAEIPTDRGLMWGDAGLRRMARRLFAEVTFKLDYLHKEGLPGWLSPLEALFRPLEKFGLLGLHKFLPYRIWFQRDFARYVSDVLDDPVTKRMPYWNPRLLPNVISEHRSGKQNYMREIGAILTLVAVERTLLKSGETGPAQRIVSPLHENTDPQA